MIILPRQARDKHRQNSKKEMRFPHQGFGLAPGDVLHAQSKAVLHRTFG
jgi:hypothetical protein